MPGFLQAQMLLDTLDLSEVEIFSNKPDNSAGYKVFQIDSVQIRQFQTQSLSGLITSTTPVFVKSYGHGSLATSSIRGASATHTEVVWNGININSPMPGQADFSQIPVFFADKIMIYYGPGSIFQTSGGLGGSINIETKTNWQNRLNVELLQEVASFKTYSASGKVSVGNPKFQSVTRLFYLNSANNYDYDDISVSRENPPSEQRQNAVYQQKGLLQEFAWKSGKKTTISAKLWMQDNFREIPPNMLVTVPDGNENSQESLIRGLVGMEHYFAHSNLKIQSGILYNFLNYKNELSQIDADNTVTSSVNLLEHVYHGLDNLVITTRFDFDHHQVVSDNYPGTQIRNEGAFCVGANYSLLSRATFNLLLRQEMIDNKIAPFTPSFGVNFKMLKNQGLYLKANIARNFNVPSLNDLYWSPGGNHDLDFESGFSWETGLAFREQFEQVNLNAELTWFYSDIDNWILWQPDSVFSYWTPSNLKNVISKGLEAMVNANGTFAKFDWTYSLQYAFTSARNMKPVSEGDHAVNKQLIYVPEHSLNQNIGVGFGGFRLNYTLNFTGERFTTSDNSRYLPSFILHDIFVGKTLKIGKSTFHLQLMVNNLMDTQYQVIAWQPMPGRNFSFSVKYGFNK